MMRGRVRAGVSSSEDEDEDCWVTESRRLRGMIMRVRLKVGKAERLVGGECGVVQEGKGSWRR